MFIGTSSILPGSGFNSPAEIDVASAYSTNGYQGYMMTDTYIGSTFSSVPSGLNSWRWTICDGSIYYKCGANLNGPDGGDPTDEFAVIEVCKQSSALEVPYIYVDDIAIAIY